MIDLDELRSELDELARPEKQGARSPREERIIAGFEEIQRFVEQHGRAPRYGEDRDIFERLYAVRLERLCMLEECRSLLSPLDHQGLLDGDKTVPPLAIGEMSDDELLSELQDAANPSDITDLRHVRPRAEIRAAEEIANREKCEDFERFRPLFRQAESELKSGVRQAYIFGRDTSIDAGDFFVLGGQLVYVAEVGETIKAPNGENDARLRAIYANATESNLLRRSLQRALYKDESGRRISKPESGSLFSDDSNENRRSETDALFGANEAEGDIESGTIYVLRSHSTHPFIAEHRELIHKIGVTGGKVETRIANAAHDATYLLADVEIVATYKLIGINRVKLEKLLHRLFAPAQLQLAIPDRFGHPAQPKEWFLAPLHVIDEAVERIRNGSITEMVYDPKTATLAERQTA